MNEQASPSRQERLDAVLAEYLQAVDAGQAPDRQEWLGRHPDLAEELAAFLSNQKQIDRLAVPGDPAATLAPGETAGPGTRVRYLGDYELLAEIARGGMGVVYRARQVSLNRIVAVKMILAGNLASEADVRRFRAEAEAAATLEHPNILPIYEIGEHEGQHYFSMKLIEGGSLAVHKPDAPAKDSRSFAGASGLCTTKRLATVARAVHFAHQRGILHRDLKPANILVDAQGQPHVTDFGLAKRVKEDSGLTQSGAILGTPGYMAPEQARGEKQLSTAVDVYSLGAILYEMLTGRPPFRAATALDTVLQVLDQEPEHPRKVNPQADRDLAVIALRCLEKDPAQRYQSAAAVADDLERWLAGEPIVARPARTLERVWKWARRRPAVAALVGVSAAAAIVLLATLAVSTYLISEKQAATEKANGDLVDAVRQVVAEKLQTQKALDARTLALEGEKRAAYVSRVGLAYDQWRQDNAARARQLLASCPKELRGWEWRYLSRLLRPERIAIAAHPRGAGLLVFSRDGTRLLTGGGDGKVRVWDTWSGKMLLDLPLHSGSVRGAVFSQDGKSVISCSGKEVLRWDAAGGKSITILGVAGGTGLSLSPDGNALAVVGIDKQARVFELATTKLLYTVPAEGAVFSPAGKLLATAAGDVVLRDAATGKELYKLENASAGYSAVGFSGDGSRMIAVGGKVAAIVWEVATRRVLFKQRVGTGALLSPDGKRLAGGWDRQVRFWDVTSGAELPAIHSLEHWVLGMAWSPDGRSFATATGDPLFAVPDVGEGDFGAMFLKLMLDAALKPGAGLDVRIWDAPTSPEGRPLAAGKGPESLAFRKDGLLAVGCADGIELWDLSARRRLRVLEGHKGSASRLAFTLDGRLVSGGADQTTRVWDPETGKQICSGPKHDSGLTALVILPGGTQAASAGGDETVIVWDIATGKELWRQFGPAEQATHLAVLDAKTLLRCSTGGGFMSNDRIDYHPGQAQLFDLGSTLKRGTLKGIKGYVNDLVVSPDGRVLAMLSSLSLQGDGVVQLFDTKTGAEIGKLSGEAGRLLSLAFTPDSKRLALAAGSNIKLWDLKDRLELISLPGGATRMAFSPDGQYLVTVGGGEARVFEATPPAKRIEPPASDEFPEPQLSNEPLPDPLPAAARQAMQRAEATLMVHRDLGGALLWTVQALKKDPKHADVYRTHIGLLLQDLQDMGPFPGGVRPAWRLTLELPRDKREGEFHSVLSTDGQLVACFEMQHSPNVRADWVGVFDLRSGKLAGPPIHLKDEILDQGRRPICFVPGGRQIVLSCCPAWNKKSPKDYGGRAYRLRTYDIASGKPVGAGLDPGPPYDWYYNAYPFWVTGDGRWLVAQRGGSAMSRAVEAWELKTGKRLSLPRPYNRLSFSADGRYVLAAASALDNGPSSHSAVVYDLKTGQQVGRPMHLPRTSIARVRLSPDGRVALFVDDNGRQVRVYTVADGRCTIARPLAWNGPAVDLAPAGDRVAIWDGAVGGTVEVRDVATGRLLTAPVHTSYMIDRLQFSADGRWLTARCNTGIRLLDVETGLLLGPWLAFTRASHLQYDLADHDSHLAPDRKTLLTRKSEWCRFRIFDLRPDTPPLAELETLAELHAGRKLTDKGELAPLSLEEYQKIWRAARAAHPGWFAPEAVAAPPKAPAGPLLPKSLTWREDAAAGKAVVRPAEKPDYAGVLRRFGGADRPPLVSVAAALEEPNGAVRRAALSAAMALDRGKPFTLALLIEALKDRDMRDWAIDRLGALGPDAVGAVPALVVELRWAHKQNTLLRSPVARALGHIGPGAAEAVPALRELLAPGQRGHLDFEIDAARALGRIGPAAKGAAGEMTDLLLKYPSGNENAVLMRALERLGMGATEIMVPRLTEALRRTPDNVRLLNGVDRRIGVLEMIRRLGPKATAPGLRALLAEPAPHDSGDLLRPAAAEALWQVEGGAEDALKLLIADASARLGGYSPGRSTRRGRAAQALGRIGAPAKAAISGLRDLLAKGETLPDRLDAAEALWRLTSDARPALPLIIEVLKTELKGAGDPLRPVDKRAQTWAIAVLAVMGPAARDAAPALAAAIRAEDEFNARQKGFIHPLKQDEEDEDPDTTNLIRRVGLPVLERLDAGLARALAAPAKRP
jgi:WD40 repeat protein